MILQGKSKTPVREAVLHCAAIKTGQFAHMRAFQVFATINQWHIERGFKGFGYHGLFMPDGTFYGGRPLTMQGAHVIGHNAGTWGLLMIESREVEKLDREATFADFYTLEQLRAVRAWLRQWPQLERVSGHNDYAKKLCPGFKVFSHQWL